MTNKEIALKRIINNLKSQAEYVKESKALSEKDKIEQLQVIYEVTIQIEDIKRSLEKLERKEKFERED